MAVSKDSFVFCAHSHGKKIRYLNMADFSDMDTSIYWNQARKYLPAKINILLIAESPPAFKSPDTWYRDPIAVRTIQNISGLRRL